MNLPKIEVEIKSLLGSKENADLLVSRMSKMDKNFANIGHENQLNHYFTKGNIVKLSKSLVKIIGEREVEQLTKLLQTVKTFSVRTRESDSDLLFVFKAVVDSTTSANGTARYEFEKSIDLPSIKELDEIVLSADFEYQAKWSRERNLYSFFENTVSIDRNAGYGYLTEFERLVDAHSDLDEVKSQIRGWLKKLGIVELSQERLERMFDFYNKNWKQYYGTNNIFHIE